MVGTQADLGAKAAYEIPRQIPVDKMAGTLLGREAYHHPQPVRCRDVEKRARRHRVRNSNSIDAQRGHLREIAINELIVGKLAAGLVRPERTIGDATNKEGF